MDDIAIVITGAAPLDQRAVDSIPRSAIVIAADGALDHALEAGLQPAALVGDLDSVSPAGLAWADAHATVQRHAPDKNHTDTELALATAAGFAPERLTLIAGGGDRLDHTIAAIGALGHPTLTSVPHLDAWWGPQQLMVLHGPGRLRHDLPIGTVLSLIAMHGPCAGVSVTGVRWPLDDAALAPVVGHAISNETISSAVEIAVTSGVLTIFINDPEESS